MHFGWETANLSKSLGGGHCVVVSYARLRVVSKSRCSKSSYPFVFFGVRIFRIIIGGVHCFLAAVPQIWGCWAPERCSGLGSCARRLLHGIYGALARLSRLLPAFLLLLDSTCLDTGRRSSCSCELSARDHKLVRLRDAAAGDHRTSARPAAGADRASCMGPDSRSLGLLQVMSATSRGNIHTYAPM